MIDNSMQTPKRVESVLSMQGMMDPKEEQEAELEALEAIFDQDFQLIEAGTSTSGAQFSIQLCESSNNLRRIGVLLKFTHAIDYPNSGVGVVVQVVEGLSTPQRRELQEVVERTATEHGDMPCVFSVCEAAREWVTERVVGGVEDGDETGQFETLDATQGEKVEVISSKAVGTAVTVESFAAWREEFMREMEMAKSREELERERNVKMTGREMFESRSATAVLSAESESFWEAEARGADGIGGRV